MSLTEMQRNFLQLHNLDNEYIAETRELFQGATIRCKTSRGKTATASRIEIDALIADGFMNRGWDGRSFYATEKGKALQ